MTDLILKKGKERSLLRRHPWVYDTAVQKLTGKAVSGDTVRVCSYDGRFLAWAAYSKDSTLRARCWSFDESEQIDDLWIETKIKKSVSRKTIPLCKNKRGAGDIWRGRSVAGIGR